MKKPYQSECGCYPERKVATYRDMNTSECKEGHTSQYWKRQFESQYHESLPGDFYHPRQSE